MMMARCGGARVGDDFISSDEGDSILSMQAPSSHSARHSSSW